MTKGGANIFNPVYGFFLNFGKIFEKLQFPPMKGTES